MKMHKTLFLIVAVLVIPCPAAYPVIQEVQTVLDNISTYTPNEAGSGQPAEVSPGISEPYTLEAGNADALEQLLSGQPGLSNATFETETGQGESEQEEILEGQVGGQQDIPFWRRPSILISGALLMGLGILFTILAASGSGSSSNSSSSSGSSGTGGDSQGENGPQQDNAGNPPGGGGAGGGSGGGDGTGGNDFLLAGSVDGNGDGSGNNESNIPSNPEPATLLLLASGLGLAFMKKKNKF